MNTRKNVLRAWTISVIETLEDGISPYSPIKKKIPKTGFPTQIQTNPFV